MIGDANNLSIPEIQVPGCTRDGHFTVQKKEDGLDGFFTLILYDGLETAEINISRQNAVALCNWLLTK